MYNRYIRGDGGTYTRVSMEDTPLPPPAGQRPPPPPSAPPGGAQSDGQTPHGPPPPPQPSPERGLLNGLLEKLHLSDLDAGDILLLLLLFFLFRQEADEDLLIAIGLLLIL